MDCRIHFSLYAFIANIKLFNPLRLYFTGLSFLLFITIYPIFGQELQSKIHYLRGGDIRLNLHLGLSEDFDFGFITSKGQALPSLSERSNPAFLYIHQKNQIIIKAGMPFSVNVSKLLGLNTTLQQNLNSAIQTYRTSTTDLIYPEMTFDCQMALPFEWISVVIQRPTYQFSISYENEMDVSGRFQMINTETSVSTPVETGSGESDVILNAKLDGLLNTTLRVQKLNAILSFPFSKKTIFGLQVSRLYTHMNVTGLADMDASMLYSGKEYLFNDPNALWPTDLGQEMRGRFNGNGWQYRMGVSYFIRQNTIFDFAFDTGAFFRCQGDMDVLENRIPAFNIDALISDDEDVEILDASELKLSQLTLTERVENPIYSNVRFSMPAFFKIGFLEQVRPFYFRVDGSLFLGHYALRYGDSHINLHPNWRFNLGVSVWKMAFRAGVIKLHLQGDGNDNLDKLNASFILPEMALSMTIRHPRKWVLTHILQIAPIPSYHVLLGVEF